MRVTVSHVQGQSGAGQGGASGRAGVRRGSVAAVLTAALIAAGLAAATPASADFCLQLSGALSGDLGFFRFKGPLHTTPPGAIQALTGRVAGLSPAFGASTVAKDGSFVEFGVTFFADATQGQFDVFLSPPQFTAGSGFADYGTYGVNSAVSAAVVSCGLEP